MDKPGKHFYGQQFSIIWPGGQVNRDCTTKRQTSERELDEFWKQVDLILEPVVKKAPTSTHEFLQAAPAGTLKPTPDWVVTRGLKRSLASAELEPVLEPAPNRAKTKIKTRGTADPSQAPTEEAGSGQYYLSGCLDVHPS